MKLKGEEEKKWVKERKGRLEEVRVGGKECKLLQSLLADGSVSSSAQSSVVSPVTPAKAPPQLDASPPPFHFPHPSTS